MRFHCCCGILVTGKRNIIIHYWSTQLKLGIILSVSLITRAQKKLNTDTTGVTRNQSQLSAILHLNAKHQLYYWGLPNSLKNIVLVLLVVDSLKTSGSGIVWLFFSLSYYFCTKSIFSRARNNQKKKYNLNSLAIRFFTAKHSSIEAMYAAIVFIFILILS